MNNTRRLATDYAVAYAEHLRNTIARMAAHPEEADLTLLAAMADRLNEAINGGPLAVAIPCDFGSDIWWIDDDGPRVACEKGGVAGFLVYEDGVMIADRDGGFSHVGDRDCFLSEEDAKNYLYCATTPGEA